MPVMRERGRPMGEARTLIERVSEFRRRLEQMPVLAEDPRPPEGATSGRLEERVREGARQQEIIENAIRRLSGAAPGESGPLPGHLTARSKRLLGEGRALVGELRGLGDEPLLAHAEEDDPLTLAYRQTVAMTEACLRVAATFPEPASQQMRLCDGLTAMFEAVRGRARLVRACLEAREAEARRVDAVAGLLRDLDEGVAPGRPRIEALCDDLLAETDGPLRFASVPADGTRAYPGGPEFRAPTRAVAAHSLTVARVAARLTLGGPEVGLSPRDAVRAALVHDVGMLRVPAELLAQAGPLADGQKRAVEAHVRLGAEAVMRLVPDPMPILDAVAQHHERLNGAGYPAGLKGDRIGPPARLLAVADVYAAMATPRPQRAAFDPRTALTDTLLLAEKGELDRVAAGRLLRLSFYPAGTLVEMADGSIGVVAANPAALPEHARPDRPVVCLLTDAEGAALPEPRLVDLSRTEVGGIVRGVPAAWRRKVLGGRWPQYS